MKQKSFYFILAIVTVGTLFISTRSFNDNDKTYFEVSKNLRLLSAVYDKLNVYYVDEPQPGKLMKTGIDAMLKSLDPYTVYIPQSKIEDYRYMTTGQYGGIGSMIQSHGEYVVISEPYESSPAAKAGLKAGDVILEVDDKNVVGKTVSDMSLFLKGGAGTKLKIKYKREDEIGEVEFEREEIKVPDIPYFGMVDENTGYIKLNSFTKTASQEVGKALYQLRDSNQMTQLVFDLRGNGGGLLHEAVNIVNFFVPKGELVVSTKGRLEEINRVYKTRNAPFDLDIPLVVLIDGYSASASEIVSGSLQDLDRAVIIGETSYGKGLVQQTKEMKLGSLNLGIVKLTVAKYYTPSGRCIQKLDYSKRSAEGSVEKVPDSLIATFSTKNGRIVKDGRGVDPDVWVAKDSGSILTGELLVNHHIFDFATQYERKHSKLTDAKSFSLSKDDYQNFVTYVEGEQLDYTTDSKNVLDKLIKTAQYEKYYMDSQSEFDALLAKLTPSLQDDLYRYEDEIKRLLEEEIVSRYFYRKGRIMLVLKRDNYLHEAIDVLEDKERYSSLLKG